VDTLTIIERSERMRRVRSSGTAPERKLRSIVWSLGYRYRKNRRDIAGCPDIAMLGTRKAIFLHGCFWHRHDCKAGQRAPKSRIDFWSAKFERNVQRDSVVQQQLAANGWASLVIWECELSDIAAVEQRVRRFFDA
jgi:DNA mismatch endonuclease (patch repair protein)